MRFKKLQLLGFKTFAEPTEFLFEPGVTAIVGPNGTGKSNVADAIKWVLGEQSARELRGGHMEDLIFNGSDRRDPLNYAEVTLTLDNSDKQLPLDYAEVAITRRLYRSGESEYLLNQTAVRLKDITQLLMGTGIGTSAYSLFEQGRIEQIINAKPEERRVIFEEAAGITRFKTQKREALRKLEETESNLLRVSDVIAEVKRQIQALERQVKRAKAYQEQLENLKQMELRLARYEEEKLTSSWREKEISLQALRQEAQVFADRLGKEEEILNERRKRMDEADQEFTRTRESLYKALHRRESTTEQLTNTQERLKEDEARRQRLSEETEENSSQLERLTEQHRQLSETVLSAKSQKGTKEEELAKVGLQLEECACLITQAKALIQKTQEALLEETNLIVGARNRVTQARQAFSREEARWNRLSMEKGKVALEVAQASEQLKALEGLLAQARAQAQDVQEKQAACRRELEVAQEIFVKAQEEASHLGAEAAKAESQLELLNGLLTTHEGYASGIRELLLALDKGELPREGVSGVLAELIQVAAEDTAAVDAALGPYAQALVVESVEAADRCRSYLTKTKAGRVLFLIRSKVTTNERPVSTLAAIPLIERVGVTPHLEPLLRLLLADTWLIQDRDAARSLLLKVTSNQPAPARALGGPGQPVTSNFSLARFVSPAGELFTATSELLGSAPLNEGMVVGRRSRLKSLEVTLQHLHACWEEAKKKMETAREECRGREESLSQREAACREKSEELHRCGANRTSSQAAYNKFEEEEGLLATECEQSQEELEAARAALHGAEQELHAKEETLSSMEETVTSSQQEIGLKSQLREEISVRLATLKTELSSFDQVAASQQASLSVLEQTMAQARAQMAQRGKETEELVGRRAEGQALCGKLEGALQVLAEEEKKVQAQVEEAETHREEILGRAQEEERQFQAISRQMEEIQRKIHQEEMEQTRLDFQKQQIRDRLLQVYQLDLAQAAGDPSDCPGEEEAILLQSEVEGLSQKLQRIGPVNLGSIDEERELLARHEHLSAQQNDLTKAKDDLHEAITRINRTTRAMFRETFEAVQKEFQTTFKQLFGGGEARLVLLDEEDVLESGIEIIARPPGKTVQAISLLSGGEKALTTMALLFAIFRIKPSPFCLMDEIDAPLDEANIGRFAGALREFLKESQFIIITHNKKTITMADIMYGITMEESGVSKIVSVKFKENGVSGNGANGASSPTPEQPSKTQS